MDLPADMQQLLCDITDRYDLDRCELTVQDMPMHRFPVLPCVHDFGDTRVYRSYLVPTRLGLLPPVVIVGSLWIDGCHRVWAARRLGRSTIRTVDLTEIGIDPATIDACNVIANLKEVL